MITIFKIKKGKEKKLERWLKAIKNKHWAEAVDSVWFEGITREATTIIGNQLIFLTEGIAKRRSYDKISVKHREIMKECCIFPPQRAESIYDIEII